MTYSGWRRTQCRAVRADETGWRIGSWLRVFTCRTLIVYTIDTSRGHKVAVNIRGRESNTTDGALTVEWKP